LPSPAAETAAWKATTYVDAQNRSVSPMSSKDPERVLISTYLPSRDAALIHARARAGDRSVAGEIRHALRGYLGREDDEAAGVLPVRHAAIPVL
jgi:hypothetical protein